MPNLHNISNLQSALAIAEIKYNALAEMYDACYQSCDYVDLSEKVQKLLSVALNNISSLRERIQKLQD